MMGVSRFTRKVAAEDGDRPSAVFAEEAKEDRWGLELEARAVS